MAMPSTLEDIHAVNIAPTLGINLPLAPYNVQILSGSIARLIPIHDSGGVSDSLISYLAQEMNDEV